MQNTKNPLIFIIEDSIIYKDLILGYLQSNGHKNIKHFRTAEECMKRIDHKPDIIVLDYNADGLSGLEFMQKVKKDNPQIDFIFLSGQSNVQVAVQIMKKGAADYIEKNEKAPYRLMHSIENLLSKTKQEKIQRGINIGVVGFFVMLFIIIMTILMISIFFDIEM